MRLVTLLLTSLTLLISGMASADVDIKPGEYVVFYHHDVLGSPVTATNELGQVIWHERTESYGKSEGRVSQDGTAFGDNALPAGNSRQGYTGHTLDNSAGLTYMKARYYDHHIGRFLSNDPIGFTSVNPMMFNRYAYASGNPYSFVDTTGMSAEDVLIILEDIRSNFPEMRPAGPDEVQYQQLDNPDAVASTHWRSGDLLLPIEAETEKLNQQQFTDLYYDILHETMHRTDTVFQRIRDGLLKSRSKNEREIHARESFERYEKPGTPPWRSMWGDPKEPRDISPEDLYLDTREETQESQSSDK